MNFFQTHCFIIQSNLHPSKVTVGLFFLLLLLLLFLSLVVQKGGGKKRIQIIVALLVFSSVFLDNEGEKEETASY